MKTGACCIHFKNTKDCKCKCHIKLIKLTDIKRKMKELPPLTKEQEESLMNLECPINEEDA